MFSHVCMKAHICLALPCLNLATVANLLINILYQALSSPVSSSSDKRCSCVQHPHFLGTDSIHQPLASYGCKYHARGGGAPKAVSEETWSNAFFAPPTSWENEKVRSHLIFERAQGEIAAGHTSRYALRY